ncbi:Eco57I restriction-modification methylase domain-containing protein [Promicromonospora sp. CA-289599]|uniref:Eco57I restriction-modification methylase domain-containing protein n=1 Tax=Promicromonospora sp. CA-289599 TaxID=3240014 RepID=UPI003D926C7D
MLEVLRSVQYAPIGGESRRISFRDIGVEQIGYIYEGLLGYTSLEVDEVTVGLIGKDGEEPEVPLDTLDDLWEEFDGDPKADENAVKALAEWVKKNQPAATLQPKSASGLVRKLNVQAEDAERALLSVTRDKELIARLRPYLGLVRRDLRDRPVVIQPGGLSVVETKSRANAGAHYTPKSLAQEVVLHALEPLVYSPGPHQSADRETWRAIDSNQILDLKIADIACGSGAFLVAAAEYLADRLVEAWHREGIESLTSHELLLKARRAVVASCLYGADINAMAVEMCKLSLWLVSLDPGQPFSFVDDKVFHGNSLLGLTDVKQIEEVHIDPGRVKHQHSGSLLGVGGDVGFVETVDVRAKVRALANLRRQIAGEIVENDVMRSANAKKRLWTRYQTDAAELTCVADGVIAAGLKLGGKQGRALDEKYQSLRIAVDRAFAPGGDRAMLDGIVEHGLTPTVETDYKRWKPLHWALAVPDVFEHGGFDAIVGNPPFLGGKKVSGVSGSNVREWFVNVLAGGAKGNADLVAYFFLRATSLLSTKGTLGLIATNTVAQGDTREVGLDAMVADGFTITRAVQSRPWPARSANLEYAAVWGTREPVSASVPRLANDVEVSAVSTLLEPQGQASGNPMRLTENSDTAFIGCYVLGMGFVLDPAEAQEWIATDARNTEVLFPYLNGEDLNSRPDASSSRWVIDFNDRDESEAATYRLPYSRASGQVKPERQRLNTNRDFVLRKPLPQRWWQYADKRPALRRAITRFDEVLAIALVSKNVMPMRVPTGQVFSHMLGVFATDSYSDQAVLSSNLHQIWAITHGSGMRNDPRYTPSDVFETFPRPEPTERLEAIGRTLDKERREIMLRRDLGLTKLYNLVNDTGLADTSDADVARLRGDPCRDSTGLSRRRTAGKTCPLDHGFHAFRQMTRWMPSPAARIEMLDRLLAHEPYGRSAEYRSGEQLKPPIREHQARIGRMYSGPHSSGVSLMATDCSPLRYSAVRRKVHGQEAVEHLNARRRTGHPSGHLPEGVEAVVERNVLPAVRRRDNPIEFNMDRPKAGDIGVGRVGKTRVVYEVVQFGQAEVTAEHDVPTFLVERSANGFETFGRLGAGKSLEHVRGCVTDPRLQCGTVGDRPDLVQV